MTIELNRRFVQRRDDERSEGDFGGLSYVWPFQAKPSAITITRCDCRSHSRTRTVPGVSSVRFWSKLARRANIAGPVSFAAVRSSTCLVS